MSNRSDARAKKTFEGWIGEFRPTWKATYMTVQEVDARGNFTGPKTYKSKHEAECAAWRSLRDMEQPVMVGTGEIISKARLEFEKLFGGVKA